MTRPEKYDVYADPMWAELGGYPVEVRPATRWERFVWWCKRTVRR